MLEVEDTVRRCEICQTPIISGRFCGIDDCKNNHLPHCLVCLKQISSGHYCSEHIKEEFNEKVDNGKLVAEIAERDERIKALEEGLAFYADPENYHAISFMFDRPCGLFSEDFDEDHGHEDYDRPMPGKLARNLLTNPAPKE